MAEKIGILFSSGLESTSLIEYYFERGYKIELIYIKSGFYWEKAEILHAQKIATHYSLKLKIIEYKIQNNKIEKKDIYSLEDNIILLRNLFLSVAAANYLLKNNIFKLALGLVGDASYPDTSLSYISDIERLISMGSSKKFSIELPFYGMSKKKIFKQFKDKIPLKDVFSCVMPDENNNRCHKCYKCKKLDSLLDLGKNLK